MLFKSYFWNESWWYSTGRSDL